MAELLLGIGLISLNDLRSGGLTTHVSNVHHVSTINCVSKILA